MEALREAERLKEQRRWLSRHTKDAALTARHGEYFRHEQVLKHLLVGADFEGDPLREVETALHFAASKSDESNRIPRGHKSKSLHKSKAFTTAIERLEEYDDESRWRRGLNAITLLTEYRRKIIFHAMLDTKDVDEERAVARDKLDAYLCTYAPELLERGDELTAAEVAAAAMGQQAFADDASVPRMAAKPIVFSSESVTASDKRRTATLSNCARSSLNNFTPKWGEFDVMKNRWRYIKPQIKDLLPDSEMIKPNSSEKIVTVSEVPVRGTLSEATDFRRRALAQGVKGTKR